MKDYLLPSQVHPDLTMKAIVLPSFAEYLLQLFEDTTMQNNFATYMERMHNRYSLRNMLRISIYNHNAIYTATAGHWKMRGYYIRDDARPMYIIYPDPVYEDLTAWGETPFIARNAYQFIPVYDKSQILYPPENFPLPPYHDPAHIYDILVMLYKNKTGIDAAKEPIRPEDIRSLMYEYAVACIPQTIEKVTRHAMGDMVSWLVLQMLGPDYSGERHSNARITEPEHANIVLREASVLSHLLFHTPW